MVWGIILIVLGVVFLLENMGIFSGAAWEFIWPIVLVGIGVWMVMRNKKDGVSNNKCGCGKPGCPECDSKVCKCGEPGCPECDSKIKRSAHKEMD
ncbi:MAG TPA: DUF5668 domain-containing protein [Candidatus Paceibacterota bacterium]|nr:DUF5668 domain-containing protein [Candidatus Paceibacterota bacterium]